MMKLSKLILNIVSVIFNNFRCKSTCCESECSTNKKNKSSSSLNNNAVIQ
jgi:hypothetical protein